MMRAARVLRRGGWQISGWFPGDGPLVDEAAAVLTASASVDKPIAVSTRGWLSEPGLRSRLRRTPGYLRAFDRWLQAQAPEIVHVNSLQMLPEATVARRRGLPLVIQVHEIPVAGRKRDLTVRWSSAVGDVLVGVSGPVTEMLREHARDTPVLTVHNGVPETAAVQADAHDGMVIGAVGHVSWTKGTDVFLQAARLALAARPGLRFEHVGPPRLWGDAEFDTRVEQLAAAPELRGRLVVYGQRPAADLLGRWSVFVHASRQEGFPLSTLEAMAAGVPVIACEVGGVAEQIEHLVTGILVASEDPAAISEWIVRLHDDAALRAGLAARARAWVRERFPVRAQAQALERAYAQAITINQAAGRTPAVAQAVVA